CLLRFGQDVGCGFRRRPDVVVADLDPGDRERVVVADLAGVRVGDRPRGLGGHLDDAGGALRGFTVQLRGPGFGPAVWPGVTRGGVEVVRDVRCGAGVIGAVHRGDALVR